MATNKLSKSFKVCATCGLWAGARTSEFGGFAKFESSSKGKCCGGSFSNLQMPPMGSCKEWEIWPPIRR